MVTTKWFLLKSDHPFELLIEDVLDRDMHDDTVHGSLDSLPERAPAAGRVLYTDLADTALTLAERIGARRTYFTHISHLLGLHADVSAQLPPGVELAYDGLVVGSAY